MGCFDGSGKGLIGKAGNLISNIPVVGNITDFFDKALYDVLDTGGNLLGLNKKGNLLGMSEDEFRNELLHPIGVAAATYGIGSALSAPALSGAAAAGAEAGAAATAGITGGTASAAGTGALSALDAANAAQAGGASTITGAAPVMETAAPFSWETAIQGGAQVAPEAASTSVPFSWETAMQGGNQAGYSTAAGASAPTVAPGFEAGATGAAIEGGSPAGYMGEGAMTQGEMAAIDAGSGATASSGGGGFMNTAMNTAGEAGTWVKDAATGTMKWVQANPMKTMAVMNVLNSLNQSGMMKDANAAQQQSYQDYLKTINPPEDVKNVRYDALAENVRTAGKLTQQKIDDALASRGVRGKGKAAPTGDVEEAKRKSLNEAYNKIFGQYNVPSTPGPVNYSPSAGNLIAGNTAQMANQGIPLALLLSKYGATG